MLMCLGLMSVALGLRGCILRVKLVWFLVMCRKLLMECEGSCMRVVLG